jgi:uncharacterized protein YkwD
MMRKLSSSPTILLCSLLVALLLSLALCQFVLGQDAGTNIYLPVVLRGGAVAPVVPTPTPPNNAADQVVALINQARVAQGCAPLAVNSALRQAAQAHSTDMLEHDFFSHTGSDGSSPEDRMARVGYAYSSWGENIAAGYSTADEVVDGWMSSPGHRANILNCAFDDTGVGYVYDENDSGNVVYYHYWTQVFGTPQ